MKISIFYIVLLGFFFFTSCDSSDENTTGDKPEIEESLKLENLEDAKKVVASFERVKKEFLKRSRRSRYMGCDVGCESIIDLSVNGIFSGGADIFGDYLGIQHGAPSYRRTTRRGKFNSSLNNFSDLESIVINSDVVFKYDLDDFTDKYASCPGMIAVCDNTIFKDSLNISGKNVIVHLKDTNRVIIDTLEIDFTDVYTKETLGERLIDSIHENKYFIKNSKKQTFVWGDNEWLVDVVRDTILGNVIVNGSFEEGYRGWESYPEYDRTKLEIIENSTAPAAGFNSLKIKINPSVHEFDLSTDIYQMIDPFSFIPGCIYILSFWAKVEEMGDSSNLYVRIRETESPYRNISGDIQVKNNLLNEWKQYEREFTAVNRNVPFRLAIDAEVGLPYNPENKYTVFIDGVSVKKK